MLPTRKFLFRLTTIASSLIFGLAFSANTLHAQEGCARFAAGSAIQDPEDLYSQNGVLEVSFTYQTAPDAYGETLYCFVNSDGAQSPTLHVNPGDRLIINLTNLVPDQPGFPSEMPAMEMAKAGEGGCGATQMTSASVNLHYHGTNTPPVCHQDEVIHTIVNSGQTFRYEVHFPKNEPPGLYWYHPHIHHLATAAVLGGASGAIIVEGIENVNPAVAGLPQQLFVLRDNVAEYAGAKERLEKHRAHLGVKSPGTPTPFDLSVNYVPIPAPSYIPATLAVNPGETQFWRVLNASAESLIDLQLQYDGTPQPLQLIALDGVAVGSQTGAGEGSSLNQSHILIPPAGRAEFIVTTPAATVQDARLVGLGLNNGPTGYVEPTRSLVALSPTAESVTPIKRMPRVSAAPPQPRFTGLADAKPTTSRTLYFSEDQKGFYITVGGQAPRLFHMQDPPSITTVQGSVEDWTIENRSLENHEFHIHQTHFLLLERNRAAVPPDQQQYLDTINVPFWTGAGPYPSVTVRMDFRGPEVGDFVYHCHILDHEDAGMMAIIRVLPQMALRSGPGNKPGPAKREAVLAVGRGN